MLKLFNNFVWSVLEQIQKNHDDYVKERFDECDAIVKTTEEEHELDDVVFFKVEKDGWQRFEYGDGDHIAFNEDYLISVEFIEKEDEENVE